jgi:hypothetical protein
MRSSQSSASTYLLNTIVRINRPPMPTARPLPSMLHPHADASPDASPPAVAVSPPRLQPAGVPRLAAADVVEFWRVDRAHLVRLGRDT